MFEFSKLPSKESEVSSTFLKDETGHTMTIDKYCNNGVLGQSKRQRLCASTNCPPVYHDLTF